MNRLLRRLLYKGRHFTPVHKRPLPMWPPARDPWIFTSTTQPLPAYETYERTER